MKLLGYLILAVYYTIMAIAVCAAIAFVVFAFTGYL